MPSHVTVLVVENDAMSRELARRVLTAGGYRTLLAHDGEEAIRIAGGETPDLVLMDLGLPGLDGIESARLLMQLPGSTGLRIAVLSAQALDDDVMRAREAGCIGYLTKPIGARELLDRVAELIETPIPGTEGRKR